MEHGIRSSSLFRFSKRIFEYLLTLRLQNQTGSLGFELIAKGAEKENIQENHSSAQRDFG